VEVLTGVFTAVFTGAGLETVNGGFVSSAVNTFVGHHGGFLGMRGWLPGNSGCIGLMGSRPGIKTWCGVCADSGGANAMLHHELACAPRTANARHLHAFEAASIEVWDSRRRYSGGVVLSTGANRVKRPELFHDPSAALD
jgi:hypothetical protein